jgi:hypothetical protein
MLTFQFKPLPPPLPTLMHAGLYTYSSIIIILTLEGLDTPEDKAAVLHRAPLAVYQLAVTVIDIHVKQWELYLFELCIMIFRCTMRQALVTTARHLTPCILV